MSSLQRLSRTKTMSSVSLRILSPQPDRNGTMAHNFTGFAGERRTKHWTAEGPRSSSVDVTLCGCSWPSAKSSGSVDLAGSLVHMLEGSVQSAASLEALPHSDHIAFRLACAHPAVASRRCQQLVLHALEMAFHRAVGSARG